MDIEDMVSSDAYKVVMAHAKDTGVDDAFGLLSPEMVVSSINQFAGMKLDTPEEMATALVPVLSALTTLYARAMDAPTRGTVMVNVIKLLETMCLDSDMPLVITMMGQELVNITEGQLADWKIQIAEMDVMLAAAQAMSEGAE